jgi:hypothetical protein
VLFSEFFQLFSMSDFRCRGHSVGDGYSFYVIVLVLQTSGVKAISLFGKLIAVKVRGGNAAFFASANLGIEAGHREAAFFYLSKVAFQRDGWVYVNPDAFSFAVQ